MGNTIYRPDIKDITSFNREGYRYEKIYEDLEKHIVVWKMIDTDDPEKVYKNYEVWIGMKYVNPDGTVVWRRPGDEDWGSYGWSYYGTWEFCREKICKKIEELVGEGKWLI